MSIGNHGRRPGENQAKAPCIRGHSWTLRVARKDGYTYCGECNRTNGRSRASRVHERIPTAGLVAWLDSLRDRMQMDSAQFGVWLAGRADRNPKSVERTLVRWRRGEVTSVLVALADVYCVAAGAHLSWFDPYYQQEEVS